MDIYLEHFFPIFVELNNFYIDEVSGLDQNNGKEKENSDSEFPVHPITCCHETVYLEG